MVKTVQELSLARDIDSVIEIGSYINASNIVYFVKDNGGGFDMQHYDKLFGFFQRLPESWHFEGSGIGLSSVHRINTRYGGNVWQRQSQV